MSAPASSFYNWLLLRLLPRRQRLVASARPVFRATFDGVLHVLRETDVEEPEEQLVQIVFLKILDRYVALAEE